LLCLARHVLSSSSIFDVLVGDQVFLLTGTLDSLEREDAEALIKKYGGGEFRTCFVVGLVVLSVLISAVFVCFTSSYLLFWNGYGSPKTIQHRGRQKCGEEAYPRAGGQRSRTVQDEEDRGHVPFVLIAVAGLPFLLSTFSSVCL
jgi:hypothetical protein